MITKSCEQCGAPSGRRHHMARFCTSCVRERAGLPREQVRYLGPRREKVSA